MRYVLVTIATVLIILMTLIACSSTPPQQRNAELTVTYFDKKVKHEKPTWTNMARLENILRKNEKKYLIFGANWCESCNFLRRALTEGQLMEHVEFLNVDERWVNQLGAHYDIKSIPLMIELAKDNIITNVRIGPGQIVVYLLVHLEKGN